MRGWFESTFGAGALVAQFVVALIVVIVLFAVIAAFARWRNKNAGPAQARGRQPRLAVMDMAVVDDRRKLLLIRRDNVEHLVMIGGPSDLVVESAIMRNRPAPHAADRTPDRAAAGLAMQAHSRAQARVPVTLAGGSEAASADGSRPRSADGSGDEPGETRAAPPAGSSQFVNPYKPPVLPREEKKPSPAAATAQPAHPPSPAPGPAAVAGLAAGAAALTAAAAKVKRHDTSSEPETPPEKPAKEPPVLPAGFNGSGDLTTPAADTAPDIAALAPATPEPVVSEDVTKAASEPETVKAAETAAETAADPIAAADMTNDEPPVAEAKADTDTGAAAESDQETADETSIAEPETASEPVQAAEPALAESDEMAGETNVDESPGESQPEAVSVADTSDGAEEVGEDLEAALAPAQDQSGENADISAATEPTPAEPVDTAPDLAAATTEAAAEPVTGEPAAELAEPATAKTFEEIMAENARRAETDTASQPQADLPPAPEPEAEAEAKPEAAPAQSGDAGENTADKTAGPATDKPAAISPFPTIPEDVRRSVLEAARRAESSLDAGSASADGAEKTTLGDLAERLEQALAEQASTLSGQLQKNADGKPAPGPDEGPSASIEEWERGELASSDIQAAESTPEAVPSAATDPEATPDAAPRQSQAMLEDETDSGVIDFSDRKKAAPESKPSDSLEDEMARLLGELTGGKSGR
jgi:hypothetical protein